MSIPLYSGKIKPFDYYYECLNYPITVVDEKIIKDSYKRFKIKLELPENLKKKIKSIDITTKASDLQKLASKLIEAMNNMIKQIKTNKEISNSKKKRYTKILEGMITHLKGLKTHIEKKKKELKDEYIYLIEVEKKIVKDLGDEGKEAVNTAKNSKSPSETCEKLEIKEGKKIYGEAEKKVKKMIKNKVSSPKPGEKSNQTKNNTGNNTGIAQKSTTTNKIVFYKKPSVRYISTVIVGVSSYIGLYAICKKDGYNGSPLNPLGLVKFIIKNYKKFDKKTKILIVVGLVFLTASMAYLSYELTKWIIQLFKK